MLFTSVHPLIFPSERGKTIAEVRVQLPFHNVVYELGEWIDKSSFLMVLCRRGERTGDGYRIPDRCKARSAHRHGRPF